MRSKPPSWPSPGLECRLKRDALAWARSRSLAARQVLDRAGWKLGDVERFEINEAFAAIVIGVMRELGLPEDIVNMEGGAIAHGHPIGATGAVLTTRLIHSRRRDGLRRGIVTLCIGGGQGITLALKTLS
jgi:acetyl-CoA C-acetyltransferase